MLSRTLTCLTLMALLAGCASGERPAALGEAPPATKPSEDRSAEWATLSRTLGPGTLRDGVYTIVKPRTDLQIGHLDLGDVPIGAGVESRFYFFWCPCGKMSATGQFAAADYEINFVMDELRKAEIEIAGIAPMFIGDRPRMYVVRFQGRNTSENLAAALGKALKYTSERSDGK